WRRATQGFPRGRVLAGSPAVLSVHRPPARLALRLGARSCTGIPIAMPLAHRCHVRVGTRAAVLNGGTAERKKPVNTIDDAALVEALRQQMTKSVARQVAASGNLANVDTPNYKAVEPSFADALKGQLQMAATRPNHINPADTGKGQVHEIKDAVAR